MISISKEEIMDKMFFINDEKSGNPIAVVKVSELMKHENIEDINTTNADKFTEVFGFCPDRDTCVLTVPCPDCKYYDERPLNCALQFWNDKYKE